MSTKSKKSVATKKRIKPAIDRPFAAETWRQAKALANGYRLVLEEIDNSFFGSALELPGIFADAPTAGECVVALREALSAAVATMLEMGEVPPAPASAERRMEQINIRVTPEEKLRLTEAARAKGYRGISDYVRQTGRFLNK